MYGMMQWCMAPMHLGTLFKSAVKSKHKVVFTYAIRVYMILDI